MRKAMAYADKIGTAFVQDGAEAARKQWRQVADQLRPRVSNVGCSDRRRRGRLPCLYGLSLGKTPRDVIRLNPHLS